MSYKPNWKEGSWSAICDRCGFKYKAYQLKKEWTGLMVCKPCWEPRHPQEFIKIPKDDQTVPWVRDEQQDVFITVTYVAGNIGIQDNTVPAGNFDSNNDYVIFPYVQT